MPPRATLRKELCQLQAFEMVAGGRRGEIQVAGKLAPAHRAIPKQLQDPEPCGLGQHAEKACGLRESGFSFGG
jgi:hypothetical protein